MYPHLFHLEHLLGNTTLSSHESFLMCPGDLINGQQPLNQICGSLVLFVKVFQANFPPVGREAMKPLSRLHQGGQRLLDFTFLLVSDCSKVLGGIQWEARGNDCPHANRQELGKLSIIEGWRVYKVKKILQPAMPPSKWWTGMGIIWRSNQG